MGNSMGLFNDSTVTVAGEKLHITFPLRVDGKRRNPDKGDESIHLVVVSDIRSGHDKIFQVYEPGLSGDVRFVFAEAIALSKQSGIPVIMDINGKAAIVDAFDTPEGVFNTHQEIAKAGDLQSGLDAYHNRLEARGRALKAAAAMFKTSDNPGEHAARRVDERNNPINKEL